MSRRARGVDRPQACSRCLARTWLIARLAGHLEVERERVLSLLALDDDQLVLAVAGGKRNEIERQRREFSTAAAQATAIRAGVELVCGCSSTYPAALRDLAAPPAVLHVLGGIDRLRACVEAGAAAIVGTRTPSRYGGEMASALGRGVAGAGVTVVSGMAHGIDAAAHAGALGAQGGRTVAVLPGGVDRPYPQTLARLHARIAGAGVVLGELPPGTSVRRWMFQARNRVIAALSELTIVVEARQSSGALMTARHAAELGRTLGAVPGQVTSAPAAGPHELIAGGAALIRGAGDVLDLLFGAGVREPPDDRRPALTDAQAALLSALEQSGEVAGALTRSGLGVDRGLAELAALELSGWLRRGPGGRYSVIP